MKDIGPMSKVVGLVSEEDILMEVIDNPSHFREPVTDAMESRLVLVRGQTSRDKLFRLEG